MPLAIADPNTLPDIEFLSIHDVQSMTAAYVRRAPDSWSTYLGDLVFRVGDTFIFLGGGLSVNKKELPRELRVEPAGPEVTEAIAVGDGGRFAFNKNKASKAQGGRVLRDGEMGVLVAPKDMCDNRTGNLFFFRSGYLFDLTDPKVWSGHVLGWKYLPLTGHTVELVVTPCRAE